MGIDRRGFAGGIAVAGLGFATSLSAAQDKTGGDRNGRAKTKGPAAAGTTPGKGGEPDVIILGAGISGLHAAWLLEEQGHTIRILEARGRVGGRIMTLMDQPGYPEMGFNSMAAGYGRGLDAATRAGVTMQEVGARWRSGPPPLLYINDKPMTRAEWAQFPGNPFPEAYRNLMPGELVGALIAKNTRLEDWTQWYVPQAAAPDISLHDRLRALGLSDAAIHLANDIAPYYGVNAYGVSSLMMEYNDGFTKAMAAAGTESLAVKGGNLLLPQALARQLKGDILLETEVRAIRQDGARVTVHCADGSTHSARKVICSLPFSALRHIAIDPGLSGVQAEAVAQLGYQPISMVFVTAESPFWDEDGLAPGMWTDGILGNVMPQKFGDDPAQITGLLVQARGALAQYWDLMPAETVKAMVIARIEALRPAAKGKVRAHSYFSWAQERFNGGDVSYLAPGQAAWVTEMAKPAGAIHFCGEHTATNARGLEGAMESAERAVLEVLA